MKYFLKKGVQSLFLLVMLVSSGFCGDDPVKIGYVISRTVDDMFYGPVVGFMQAAANDLGIELLIIETDDNHIDAHLQVKESLMVGRKTDAIIAISVKGIGKRILKICEQAKVSFMIENAAILDKSIGEPRQHFKYYIGEMLPDDEMAGYELAKYLLQKGKVAPDGKIHIVAINGSFGTSASIERGKGLQRALKEFPHAQLEQMVSAMWEPELAKKKFIGLKTRYPNVSVVWAASDGMAIGAAAAAEEMKLTLGKDVVIGGVDWSSEGVAAVKNGRIQATAGGHFMEGAWAMIAVYDYLKGFDFAKNDGLRMKTEMKLLTTENINEYSILFDTDVWSNINFKNFSKRYNPMLLNYDFSIRKILMEVQKGTTEQ
jgi:ABC-type sugar transport system substrate-binding protein